MVHHAFLLSPKMALPPHPQSANAAIFATSLPSFLVFILTSWQVGSLHILASRGVGDGGHSNDRKINIVGHLFLFLVLHGFGECVFRVPLLVQVLQDHPELLPDGSPPCGGRDVCHGLQQRPSVLGHPGKECCGSLMDPDPAPDPVPDPGPTPDPTPFFNDFRDTIKK